jgi:arylsulfatase
MARPLNIVLILADNLGWGELGCYGGGALRGAPTPRIDALAAQGLRFLNFNVESDCVPTRSALMTGRHPIRTGALQSVPAGLPQGLHPWERTLPQLLREAGYATAMYGKWHLGDRPGRYPHERGFDEWYGIPRTTNETLFTASPGFDPTVVQVPHVLEGRCGEPARPAGEYDLARRRLIDAELTERAVAWVHARRQAPQPFFLYLALTHLHFPTLAHPSFVGRSQVGEFADSMMEMDHRVGQVLDALAEAGLEDDTLVLFASDNGPEFRRPWRGTAGPWSGTYHTSLEGGLRVPLIARCPGRVAAGGTTEALVHVTDLYTTLAAVAGAAVPADRHIDGCDQWPHWTQSPATSAREGFAFYIKTELRAVKWRHWKLHFVWEDEPNTGTRHLETPWLFNLKRDPKEQTDVAMEDGWVRGPMRELLQRFQQTLRDEPPVPPGAPDGYVPAGRRVATAVAT